jgi:hypothetical protein
MISLERRMNVHVCLLKEKTKITGIMSTYLEASVAFSKILWSARTNLAISVSLFATPLTR